MSTGRVEHVPVQYDQYDIDEVAFIALIVYILRHNPDMYNEILCRVAMGVEGFKSVLSTSKLNSEAISGYELEMLDQIQRSMKGI